MFDVQVWRHRRSPEVPETVLDSISAYYRRVTTTASPMGRLVGLTMLVLLIALMVQAIWGDEPLWVSVGGHDDASGSAAGRGLKLACPLCLVSDNHCPGPDFPSRYQSVSDVGIVPGEVLDDRPVRHPKHEQRPVSRVTQGAGKK